MSISRRNVVGRWSSPKDALSRERGGDTNGVVEGEPEGLVDVLPALAAVEQVLLYVVADSEQRTAGRVVHHVHAIGASDTADERACITKSVGRRDGPLTQNKVDRTHYWRLGEQQG